MESIQDKNILVVDDDEHMLRALDKVLSNEGAVIATAKSAEDAIEMLIRREKLTNLVITDLRMPLVSGMTLTYAVHLMFPAVPVVVLTAFGNPELRDECIRQGAADFLEKNLSALQLLGAIEKVFTTQETAHEQSIPFRGTKGNQ